MFGPHVNRTHAKGKRPAISEHILAAQNEAKSTLAVTAVAVFLSGPRKMEISVTDEEAKALSKFIDDTGTVVIAHSAYPTVKAWKDDPFTVKFVRRELAECRKAHATGLVIHLGGQPPSAVAKVLPKLVGDVKDADAGVVRLYLETPAISPSKALYATPAALAAAFALFNKAVPKSKIGLCIDTAHLWACGIDLSSFESAHKWLTSLEANADTIPPAGVMIHLNDSVMKCGSGRDHHAGLFRGEIWSAYSKTPEKSGVAAVVKYAMKNKTPVILERKDEDLDMDYVYIADLIKKFSSA